MSRQRPAHRAGLIVLVIAGLVGFGPTVTASALSSQGGASPGSAEDPLGTQRDLLDEDPPPGVGLTRAVAALPLTSAELDAARSTLESVRERRAREQARLEVITPEIESLGHEIDALTAVVERRRAQIDKTSRALEAASAAVRAIAVEWFVTGFGALDGLDPTLTADQAELLRYHYVLSEAAAYAALADEQHLQARLAELHEERTSLVEQLDARSARSDQLVAERARLVVSLEDSARRLPDLERRVEEAAMGARVTGTDMSATALDAYWRAQLALAAARPGCGVSWWVLAGIGRIESRHGTYRGSRLGIDGLVDPPVYGPHLDGSNGFAVVPDTDGGALDGTAATDRATGPMQFLPGTWRMVGVDGDGDGVADPQNLFDAAASAAHYLCLSGPGLVSEDRLRAALFTYNRSLEYVEVVLDHGRGYLSGIGLDG